MILAAQMVAQINSNWKKTYNKYFDINTFIPQKYGEVFTN